jgi:HlyD family secretion protein
MKKLWKRIIWITVGLIVLAMVVVAFLPKPLMVDASRATRGTMQVALEAEGRTRVHDMFVVAAPVTGRLARVELMEGDPIERGAVVATIYPPPVDPLQREQLEGRIRAAEANFRQATAGAQQIAASLEQAQRERERMRALEEAGSISRQDRERAESAVVTATKELEAARYRAQGAANEVAVAKAGRGAYAVQGRSGGTVTLRSPVGGRVLRVLERSERIVPAGTPVAQVGDPEGLEIVIDVLSSDAVKIKPGGTVMIEGWGGEKALRARVKYVEPSAFTKVSALGIDEQRVNVIAEFVDLDPRIGDGFRVDARIVLWESDGVIKIPTSALFRGDGGWSVFVIREGKAVLTPVKLGQRNAFEAEVLGGVPEGAEVIVHPSDKIVDGVMVEVVPAGGTEGG